MFRLLFVFSLLAPQPNVQVVLAWTDTINQLPTTYNVYRADGDCIALAQMRAEATGVAGKSYTDPSVKANSSYCFTVTAVSNGIESIASDRITVFIPRGQPRRKNATSIDVRPDNS